MSEVKPRTISHGWQCPICRRVYSPLVKSCTCCCPDDGEVYPGPALYVNGETDPKAVDKLIKDVIEALSKEGLI